MLGILILSHVPTMTYGIVQKLCSHLTMLSPPLSKVLTPNSKYVLCKTFSSESQAPKIMSSLWSYLSKPPKMLQFFSYFHILKYGLNLMSLNCTKFILGISWHFKFERKLLQEGKTAVAHGSFELSILS